ncbi:ATP-dependent DNA ligase [Sphingomonas sp. LHG3406-1]|uniref:ATP-dependent DNA ligase n=1 Tax=Sphingomonas sp. LHG3406-1 TaxID=2804617 RepID=UPI002621F9F6|nr:ATP-dependent DNA ligase [Sphingomonas sp. LHG3406-1]
MTAPATMEALLVEALPDEPGWRFEPKWDGFRCLAHRKDGVVLLWSRSGKPLGRYFPEVVAMLAGLDGRDFLLDGELIVETLEGLSFDALSQRLHPAESRVRKLAAATPARLMAFDLLEEGGDDLRSLPFSERRTRLERFLRLHPAPGLSLSPQTKDRGHALGWLERTGGALDGVVAKRADQPYRAGERAMLKVKQHRTADCVVGGFRYDREGQQVASLLLGLYDASGLLNHVGFCSSFKAAERRAWTAELEPLIEPPGFTGDRPDTRSRWATERTAEWQPLRPVIVVELLYDQVTGGRFRHGTRLLRRRPDKDPRQCGCEQLDHPLTPVELGELLRSSSRTP